MLEEKAHDETTIAFADELTALLEKHENVSAINMVAILAQFAGQCGTFAVLNEGYTMEQVSATIGRNSADQFMRHYTEMTGDDSCPCANCVAKRKLH